MGTCEPAGRWQGPGGRTPSQPTLLETLTKADLSTTYTELGNCRPSWAAKTKTCTFTCVYVCFHFLHLTATAHQGILLHLLGIK